MLTSSMKEWKWVRRFFCRDEQAKKMSIIKVFPQPTPPYMYSPFVLTGFFVCETKRLATFSGCRPPTMSGAYNMVVTDARLWSEGQNASSWHGSVSLSIRTLKRLRKPRDSSGLCSSSSFHLRRQMTHPTDCGTSDSHESVSDGCGCKKSRVEVRKEGHITFDDRQLIGLTKLELV